MRVDRATNHVYDQAHGSTLAREHGAKFLAVALTPPQWIQSQQPPHALASRRCPVRATAIIESRRARNARSPSVVSR